MAGIPHAPAVAPASIRNGLIIAAREWFDDPDRPRVAASALTEWDQLLARWAEDSTLPLFVRKARDNRGHALVHIDSGRILVPTDNSPAHWSLALALCGSCPTLREVRELLAADRIPVAMVITAAEKLEAKYRCTRSSASGPNQVGWKVAHIADVGLGYRDPITTVPLPDLKAHFLRFLSPRNMFLVPKEYAGVAETPEFSTVFRQRAQSA